MDCGRIAGIVLFWDGYGMHLHFRPVLTEDIDGYGDIFQFGPYDYMYTETGTERDFSPFLN